MTTQEQADEIVLREAFDRQLKRLARAQALAWNRLTREEQFAYLKAVDAMEGKS